MMLETSRPGTNYQIARDNPSLLALDSAGDVLSAGVDAPLNEWIHMAMTYDEASARMYINGNLEVTASFTVTGENAFPV